jgi:hypothetical protein
MGMTQTIARSISRQIRDRQRGEQLTVRVLFAGRHACNLLSDDGSLVSLVDPDIGDGPLSIVLNSLDSLSISAQTTHRMTFSQDWLALDGSRIGLQGANIWDPCPDWHALRKSCVRIRSALAIVRDTCARRASASLFAPLLGLPSPGSGLASAALRRARSNLMDLRAGWTGDRRRLRWGATSIAGLGIGLTPSGDDLLAGAMLWAWLAHPTPRTFCRDVCRAAAPRTTALSAAFLRAAAEGQCSAPWHALLTALQTTDRANIVRATHEVLSHGATSGADALIGFLCFSLKGEALGHPMPDQA